MDNNSELKQIRQLIYRYLRAWKWFALSVFAVMFIAVAYVYLRQPVYTTHASILVKSEDEAGAGGGMSALKTLSFGFPGSMEVEDELLVISSNSMIRRVIMDLDLHTVYEQVKFGIKKTELYDDRAISLNIPESIIDTLSIGLQFDVFIGKDGLVSVSGKNSKGKDIVDIKDARFPVQISSDYGVFSLTEEDTKEKGNSLTYEVKVIPVNVATLFYSDQLSIYVANKKSNVLNMDLSGTCKSKQVKTLNKLIEIYNKEALSDKNLVYANTAEFIGKRLVILSGELEEAEHAVETYKKSRDVFNMESESAALLELQNQLEPKFIEVQSQLFFVNEIISRLEAGNEFELLPSSIGISDESAQSSLTDYNNAILERLKLLETSTKENPSLKILESRILATKANVMVTLANLKTRLELLNSEFVSRQNLFKNRLKSAPTIEKEYLNIKRNQLIKEKLVVFLLEKQEENALTLAVTAPKAKVIDYAYNSVYPTSAKAIIIFAVAFLFGLIIPVVLIYLKDLFKDSYSTRSELESLLGSKLLGEIYTNTTGENIVVRKGLVSPVVELFRSLRNNIDFILKNNSDKVLMVTSTMSGEGKTFVSINTAMSMSLTGKKVVLVGMDLRNPRLFDYMHITSQNIGVSSYLSDKNIRIEDIIHKDFEGLGLDVIVAGPIPPNPGELLLEQRLDDMIAYLREHYDYVVLDTAPVGVISDSYSFKRFTDMTLYVTRANYTPLSSVDLINTIKAEGSLNKVYAVINGTDSRVSHQGYGYGYGYGGRK